ncbi:MAG: hypothetical protein IJC18_01910 [Clostridia bacterium]|nr:hypothetical protein [Clostridia bacterium]MBQ9993645.1 hypothetical protein [Clostridia bacterium]
MKKFSAFVVGLLFLAGCAAYVAITFFNVPIAPYLSGWWTLFLIVPGLFGVFTRGSRIGAFGLMMFGVGLLLREQDKANNIFGGTVASVGFWEIFIAVLLLVIGLTIISSVFRIGKRRNHAVTLNASCSSDSETDVSCVFSSREVDYRGKVFSGGEYSNVFGSLEIDLRGAIIEGDCSIDVDNVFGKVTIYTDSAANYVVAGDQIFGSVSKPERAEVVGLPTVTVEADAVFGAVEII